MKLEQGDDIERENIEWIRTHLAVYEEIWRLFIGHNGHGKPSRLMNYPPTLEPQREIFYSAHYTLLLCLLQIKDILNNIDDQQAYIPDPRAYMSMQKEITAFLAYVGQARDMFKKMDGALNLKNTVWPRFKDLYQNRCSFLHGTTPAQKIEDGMLHLPTFAGNEKTPEKWNDSSTWSQSPSIDFKLAPDILRSIYDELLDKTRAGLSEFLAKIKDTLNEHGAYLEATLIEAPSTLAPSLSGIKYCYSASQSN